MTTNRDTDRLLRESDVAELTGMSKYTLQSWRRPGATRGPQWINIGSDQRAVVRYRESDVQAWIASFTPKNDRVPA